MTVYGQSATKSNQDVLVKGSVIGLNQNALLSQQSLVGAQSKSGLNDLLQHRSLKAAMPQGMLV